jgi:hypothetical protein
MAPRTVRRERDGVRHLLGVLHGDVEALAADDARPSAFVEREFRLDELGVVLDQPAHPPFAALLLVRVGDEDHVARE